MSFFDTRLPNHDNVHAMTAMKCFRQKWIAVNPLYTVAFGMILVIGCPLAQPIRFHFKNWERASGQDTFLFHHRFRHADFFDVLRAFNLMDTTLLDPFLRMRVGRRGHYSFCATFFMLNLLWQSVLGGNRISDYNY